jgi:cytochrome c oxidase subunit 2
LARRSSTCLAALAFALLAMLALAAPAGAISIAPEEPRSPNAEDIETAYWVMLVVAAALVVAINGALVAAVLRFRSGRGRRPRPFAAGRGALRPILGALAVLVIAVFTFGVVMAAQVRDVEPSGPGGLRAEQTAQVGVKGLPLDEDEGAPLEINAIAQQWLWRFEYPGGEQGRRTFSYGELTVPVDTTVVLNIGSTDVMHTWWVPALGGQVQASPGDVSQTWFKADEEGRYAGRSTIFSGTGFPALRSWVRVVSVPEYEQYVSDLESDLAEAQGAVQEAVAAGEEAEQ